MDCCNKIDIDVFSGDKNYMLLNVDVPSKYKYFLGNISQGI